MTPFERPDRRCPNCVQKGYMFRARKNVDVAEGKFVETRYRRRSYSHEWWERIPAPPEKKAGRRRGVTAGFFLQPW